MQIETAVLRDGGQSAAGPTALLDQSKARMRSPISPPPLRKLRSPDLAVFSRTDLGTRFLEADCCDMPVRFRGNLELGTPKGWPIKDRLRIPVNGATSLTIR